jgi:GntR family transcriptional repressor for pyruvate dehydrogenase complex
MVFDQVRQRRLSDDIVDRLEGMILEGTLTSGQRLPAERVLAEQFGVSRPSLREAIQKLVAKGCWSAVRAGQLCGRVAGLDLQRPIAAAARSSPEAQRDLLEFRHTLEASCAYYAAQRATEPDRERLKAAFDACRTAIPGR